MECCSFHCLLVHPIVHHQQAAVTCSYWETGHLRCACIHVNSPNISSCLKTSSHMATGIFFLCKIGRRCHFFGVVSAPWRRTFVVDVSAWRFRRNRFSGIVSAWSFRRRQNVLFGHIILCGNDALPCMETTHCPVWEQRTVLCGNDT